MKIKKAQRIKEKEKDNCMYVEASVVIDGIEFKACVQEYYYSTEYYHYINGMRLGGFSSKNNIESHAIEWADNQVKEFISNQQSRRE